MSTQREVRERVGIGRFHGRFVLSSDYCRDNSLLSEVNMHIAILKII
jgi:hypothetical protein